MATARFGKKNFKIALREINTDRELIDTLLDRLLEETNLTNTDRNRIIAQLCLANSRIGRLLAQIELMGQNLPEESGENLLTEK